MIFRVRWLVLLAVVACAEWGEAEVTLDSYPAPISASAPMATIESNQEPIRVRGVIAVPDRCHGLAADLTQNEGDVRLWIMHDPSEEACPPGEIRLGYTAEIEGLSPGRYTLRVVHGPAGTWRGTEPVLVHPIVVPGS